MITKASSLVFLAFSLCFFSCAGREMSSSSELLAPTIQKTACPRSELSKFKEQFNAKIVRVVDGDTVVLSNGEKLRLVGVDTPETVHPNKPVEFFGREASNFTKSILTGQEVELVLDQNSAATSYRDKYGRLLAYIFRKSDGMDFNAELIKQGFAFAYTRFPFERMEEFRCLEKQARESRSGLWNSAERPAESNASPVVAQPEISKCPIIGNTKSHIFHAQGDRHYSQMLALNSDGIDNRRCFKSSKDAGGAGYRACRRP